jgi:hypothetical protein
MPKTNEGRTTDTEANLARRIEYEREKRGMSYEALAKAMTEAGCKIHATAIHKVEKGDKQTGKLRRILVNELTAFAEVFELSVIDLLKPMELVEEERAAELLAKLQDRNHALYVLVSEMFNDFVDLTVVGQDSEDVYNYVAGHFLRSPLGADSNADAGQDEPEDGALDVLVYLLTEIARRTWHAVADVTTMYMNTLLDQERGQGPTEEELRQWVAEWAENPSLTPAYEVNRDRFIARVEDWTNRMRESNG